MRVVGIIALIGVVLLATTTAPSAATIQEIFEKNVAFKPGGLLTLDNLNGAVEIRSWDKAEVSIRARIKIGERDRKEAEKLYDEVTIAEKHLVRVWKFIPTPHVILAAVVISVYIMS